MAGPDRHRGGLEDSRIAHDMTPAETIIQRVRVK